MAGPTSGDSPAADNDQTLAAVDQTGSDRDQTSADRDQWAADRDQDASDRDLAHGADPAAYELTREMRERTARQRALTARARLQTANERDATADARDIAAMARDQAAAARDSAMAQRDASHDQDDNARALTGAQVIALAGAQRRRAAQQRVESAEQRALAAADRAAAARDREQGARERRAAHDDREALAHALALTETDPLTGARARAAGLSELDHELDRCRRNDAELVVAYVDVVGLKAINNSAGHHAGDALLKQAVACIKEHLRSYDIVVRLGGDEFLCAMSNMTIPDARERFSQIAVALAAATKRGGIRVGFAQLAAEDTAGELIARADDALIAMKGG